MKSVTMAYIIHLLANLMANGILILSSVAFPTIVYAHHYGLKNFTICFMPHVSFYSDATVVVC
jgi:hypothetical protein